MPATETPKPRSKDRHKARLPIWLPVALYAEVQAYSERTRRNLRDEAIMAIENHLALASYLHRLLATANALGMTLGELLRAIVREGLPAFERKAPEQS